ncbi:amino acid transporter [Cohnella cholangitidis]|uniref:Amino acid transporter n=1 Tax=Cohnella cholangitidis TaxID=2598458 RepID=A0A7G5C6J8_9BACL|nr:amino acid transporter [Cohnella cholangitidis]
MAAAFIHGMILAIGLIIPLGVQNFFVFSQGALKNRFSHVLPIVVTAAICDTLLIVLAVSGVSLLILHFIWMKTVLVLLGALFLLYMGIMSWRAEPPRTSADIPDDRKTGKLIGYTLLISILNPHAILDTIGVIGTSSIHYEGARKWAFMIACIAVSWAWFFFLALLGRLVGKLDHTGRWVVYLNKISAVVMWAASILLLVSSF